LAAPDYSAKRRDRIVSTKRRVGEIFGISKIEERVEAASFTAATLSSCLCGMPHLTHIRTALEGKGIDSLRALPVGRKSVKARGMSAHTRAGAPLRFHRAAARICALSCYSGKWRLPPHTTRIYRAAINSITAASGDVARASGGEKKAAARRDKELESRELIGAYAANGAYARPALPASS